MTAHKGIGKWCWLSRDCTGAWELWPVCPEWNEDGGCWLWPKDGRPLEEGRGRVGLGGSLVFTDDVDEIEALCSFVVHERGECQRLGTHVLWFKDGDQLERWRGLVAFVEGRE